MGIKFLGSAAGRVIELAREAGAVFDATAGVRRFTTEQFSAVRGARRAVDLAGHLTEAGYLTPVAAGFPGSLRTIGHLLEMRDVASLREGLVGVRRLGEGVAREHRFLLPPWSWPDEILSHRAPAGEPPWNALSQGMDLAYGDFGKFLGWPPTTIIADSGFRGRVSSLGVWVMSEHLSLRPSRWDAIHPLLKARRQVLQGLTWEVAARAKVAGRPLGGKHEWHSEPVGKMLSSASLHLHRGANQLEDLGDPQHRQEAAVLYLRSARLVEAAARRHVDLEEETGLPTPVGNLLYLGFGHAARLFEEAGAPDLMLLVGLEMVERTLERRWEPRIFEDIQDNLRPPRADQLAQRLRMTSSPPAPTEWYMKRFVALLDQRHEGRDHPLHARAATLLAHIDRLIERQQRPRGRRRD